MGRGRSRSRERRRSRSRSRDRRYRRSRSRSRSRDRDRRRRDRSRSQDRRRHRSHSSSRSRDRRDRSRERRYDAEHPPAAAEKQAARAAKLAAWKQQHALKAADEDQKSAPVPATASSADAALRKAQENAAALAARVSARQHAPAALVGNDDEVDPLDAFMAAEVLPEVKAREEEERKVAEEERKNLKELLAKGKVPKVLRDLIEDDEEEKPDMVLEIPSNKVKLVIGPGGERIKQIEKRSKCRIQHAKAPDALNRGFGEGFLAAAQAAAAAVASGQRPMVILHLFGNAEACDAAREMILEAVENKEQKAKQREKQYEKKRSAKAAERHIYHLRHARDYEVLELQLGASKAEVKAAFRKLALKWHPDKNMDNREEAEKRFQEISKAYESLMTTDEDKRVEQLGFA